MNLPRDLKFQAYTKRQGRQTEHLLHSSSHRIIDFTAIEGVNPSEKSLKHYAGVYDPATGELTITEAKRMSIRSCVRQPEQAAEEETDRVAKTPVTGYSAHAALTHAFGTKKHKKVVASMAENAVLARGANDASNALSKALLSSIPEQELVEAAEATQANKPLPTPDLTTNEIDKVYPYSSLVFPEPPEKTLSQMPIQEWLDSIAKKTPIKCTSAYVAWNSTHVIRYALANPELETAKSKVQLLRYINILVDLARYFKSTKSEKLLPPVRVIAENIGLHKSIPQPLLKSIIEHFSPDWRGLTKNRKLLLQTTILASTLHIPPPSLTTGPGLLLCEPSEISQDLDLGQDEIGKLYKELGCKWEKGSDAELQRWGYVKKPWRPNFRPKFAKLRLPLEFPKSSRGQLLPSKKRR